MSAPWKAVMSYNRYASVAASAVRNALKPDAKVKAARRGEMTLKYQDWKDGHSTDPAFVADALAKAAESKPKST